VKNQDFMIILELETLKIKYLLILNIYLYTPDHNYELKMMSANRIDFQSFKFLHIHK